MQQSYVVSGCSCSLIHFRYFRPEFGPTRPLTNLVTVALPVCSVSLHQSEYLPDMKLESGRAGLENTPFFSLVPLFKYVSYSFWHLYFKKSNHSFKQILSAQKSHQEMSPCVTLFSMCFPSGSNDSEQDRKLLPGQLSLSLFLKGGDMFGLVRQTEKMWDAGVSLTTS